MIENGSQGCGDEKSVILQRLSMQIIKWEGPYEFCYNTGMDNLYLYSMLRPGFLAHVYMILS